jgi:hypothetical protein
MSSALRPATVCRWLLAAWTASEGRRKRRKRDTTPDRIGLALERDLLERAAVDDPPPERFEAWLDARCAELSDPGEASALRAVARRVLEEIQMAERLPSYRAWLESGAPSDDASA